MGPLLKERLKGHLSTWPPFSLSGLDRKFKMIALVLTLFGTFHLSQSEVLTPPYFNLAQGRHIKASATCGESADGQPEREMYCNLVGANMETEEAHNVIGGQSCEWCEKGVEGLWHPAEYAIDGSERWWQSPPLSRGSKYNEVNLTIDLGQEFHVAYVNLRMANSPRPGVWVLEKSSDGGKTYRPWQYFADNPRTCEHHFGRSFVLSLNSSDPDSEDAVVCNIEDTKIVPLENGEIYVRLLEKRHKADDFFASERLQEWTRATHVRLRFIRTKTLLGHMMSVRGRDSSVTRRYFYSIKGIEIGGRCRCNGHADICPPAADDPYKLLCACQHNTCGPQCETCCPGYVQKAWRASTNSTPFTCEACNCYGHSNECEYDEEVDQKKLSVDLAGQYNGGGVCQNCRHNTQGINCHECAPGFFRPYGKPLDAYDVCHPCNCNQHFHTGNCEEGSGRCECAPAFTGPYCDSCNVGYYDYPNCKPCECHINGTEGGVCEVGGGKCPCKYNFEGEYCDRCADQFYNFPECLPCECEAKGSVSQSCDPENGQCECENKFGGRQCNECEHGYYNFPECDYCNCGVLGTTEERCDKRTGVCLCREGYEGARCESCLPGYYGSSTGSCKPCNCSKEGSPGAYCDDKTGKCDCSPNFGGRTCHQCSPGYYLYPDCYSCNCTLDGSMGVSCDDEGKCQCKLNFDGLKCDVCRKEPVKYYNFPLCEECNCDPAGVTDSFQGCANAPLGELCQCKERVDGRSCNVCKPLYWNLQQWNPLGCEDCDCYGPGIVGHVRVCESKSGQCPCKNNVGSRQCETCLDGYYNLTATNVFGCKECGCDVGGSNSPVCDKDTGQCPCRPRVEGKQCSSPLTAHYFPTLYQFLVEAEDGATPSGGKVRFGYDEEQFPEYSWRGYAVYSNLQPITHHRIDIQKSSLYFVILRYVNPGSEPILGEIQAIPDNPLDEVQGVKVKFEPNSNFLLVNLDKVPAPMVLDPGRWEFTIRAEKNLMVDYFTIVPEPYYEGKVLSHTPYVPCVVNTTSRGRTNGNSIVYPENCIKYKYPSVGKFDSINPLNGKSVTAVGDLTDISRFYSDKRVIEVLDIENEKMAVLSTPQPELHLNFDITKGGRYALIIEYFTPQGANLTEVTVEATSKKGSSTGRAFVQHCRYAFLCRQVVTTEDGEILFFKFDSSNNTVVLKAVPPAGLDEEKKHLDRIAINSVITVPINKWILEGRLQLDHIKPKPYCVMRNGVCASSAYDLPPDYLKVEAEAGDPDRIVSEEDMPDGVTGKGLILLDGQKRSVEMSGRVPVPGYYNILVHYFQPENPEFPADVLIQDGQHFQAKLPLSHCPSTSGCRSQVVQEDKNTRFYIQSNFVVTIKSSKNVWIDYMMLVPPSLGPDPDKDLEQYLAPSPLDDTKRFLSECGKNHFYLAPSNVSKFCRDAIFSITSEYNNGALPCECDFQGSTNFVCEEFGGQCACKENVIGRTCTRCKTGHYGFPHCEPCDCPLTALCDENTGACICPPNVMGDKCDSCKPYTYGFDALIGCEECRCNHLGVENGNMQCDLMTGSCQCKNNIVGRTCDKCKPGFWAFPYCQICDCDIRGTTEEICDQENSACHCKSNVEGRSCEQCKAGSFNLQEDNPTGCTSCFCFGKTTRCTAANMFWTQISFGKSHWKAVALNLLSKTGNEPSYNIEFEDNDISGEDESAFVPLYIQEDTVPPQDEKHILYFRVAVDSNHLASVGGALTYTLISEPADDSGTGRETFAGPDVILEGKELSPSSGVIRLMHSSVNHLDGENAMRMNLKLSEENFVVASHSPGGHQSPATRDQLMIVLKGLTAIYVRAGYWKQTREIRLNNFNIEVATDDYNYHQTDRSLSVEQCLCPANYQGLSCEECAPGYYRSPTGPFGGFCIPCQCNGHSDTCDPVSGICTDCKHNTTGDHCDMCEEGFHGDATMGTPYDCLICACPLPMASNNFATQCELSPDGREISCTCKDGYIGPRCEGCDSGFYGRPEYPGDYCKPCNCSGNIDVRDPFSCDTVTGACLRCLNNTGGAACELCAAGFYGDALERKNCRQCSCNECGTYECDHHTGDCNCLNNVEGYLCDRCKPDHYGLSRCDRFGCQYCDCGIAAVSTQCDDMTGQCECQPGTTGRRCERCAPGYWNYTEYGCQSCECNKDYAIGVGCDPETGQCSCLPGVVGEKCDRCPWRWVLIEDRGCQGCDSCQHQLLDVTDSMAAKIDPVKDEFENVAVSYFTTQKLAYFNDTVSKLRPNVQLMDPTKADLSEYYAEVDNLETNALTQRQKAETIEGSLVKKAKQSAKLREKAIELENKVHDTVSKSTTIVFETKDLMMGLLSEDRPSSSPHVEAAIAEAEAIIDSMQGVSFDQTAALNENATAGTVYKDMKKFVRPLEKLNKDLSTAADQAAEIKDKLRDLRNQSDYAITKSRQANEIGRKVKDAKFSVKFGILDEKANAMLDNAALANRLNIESPEILAGLRDSYTDLGATVQSVQEQGGGLSEMVNNLADILRENENTVDKSQIHAQNLQREAEALEDSLGATKQYADRAVTAATAYQNIEDSLRHAESAADKANEAASNASEVINRLDTTGRLVEPSRNLVVMASSAQRQVENDLKIPLRDAKSTMDAIEGANSVTQYSLDNSKKELGKLSTPRDMSDVDAAIDTSNRATKEADATLRRIDNILTKLPEHSEKMKQFRVTVSDLNSGTGISDVQLNNAKDSIPLSVAITGSLESKKPAFEEKKNELAAKLSELKAQIAAAREQANRVGVGMNIQDSSTLLLANPQSLESQQAQTRVSFFFRTQDDGLIFYLGNEPGKKEEDFMSVEVDRGYPVLTIDLGSGPQRIMNDKFVSDGRWYKALVERSGKNVRFTIAQEDRATGKVEETVKEDYLSGSKSLFNVDRNSSKLFIGGLPPGVVRSPVRYSTYRGAIEDLVIGDEKVGLWNFREAEYLNPAEERDSFIELHAETGLRFQGSGSYAILDRKQFNMKKQSAIEFRYKTRSRNGLIFLVGKGRKYMAIFMAGGHLVFQYDLGAGPSTIRARGTSNDGQWHKAEAVRYLQQGQLTVDGASEGGTVNSGQQEDLPVGNYMYWGGYPGNHGYPGVSNNSFEGCLEEVKIDQAPVDLTQAVESRYTVVGCPSSQFAPTVATFFGQGYVQVDSADSPVTGPVVVTKDDSFEVNFRLRNNATDGLLFYGSNGDQGNYLSVAVVDGALVVKTEPSGAEIRTSPLSDSEWHVVTVSRDRGKLVVNVDDDHEYVESAPGGPIRLNTPGSSLLFGGKPEDFVVRDGALESQAPYSGCLADISINGNRLDFTDSQTKDASVGQKCFTAQEKEAMALERNGSEMNGRTISKDEDEEEGEDAGQVVTPRTTTTTTSRYPQEPDYSIFGEKEHSEEHEGSEEEEKEKKKKDDMKPKPTPFMECALPYKDPPSADDSEDASMEDGVLFGHHDRTSRIEYHQPKVDGTRSEYSIDFKTSVGDGVILMWTMFEKADFIALFMRKGFLHFAFDSGAGPAYLNSTVMYNDSQWHTVSMSRFEQQGTLEVDGAVIATGLSAGSTTEVNAGTKVYVGGLPMEGWSKKFTTKKLLNVDSPFRGCLRNFKIRGRQPQAPLRKHSVMPCQEQLESGMFFYPNSGFLKISDQFKVGRQIKISMSIKPRNPSGILAAVHGDRDFMVLQLVNGSVKFTVDSGKGMLSSSYMRGTYDLCDGNWHTITVTKAKNVVTLVLDNRHSQPGIGTARMLATNTNGPLYIGGHPSPQGVPGLETPEQFVGCMRDFSIESRPSQYKVNYESIVGTVGLYGCPKD